jgi:hypothetical protein
VGYSFPDMKTKVHVLSSPLRKVGLITSRIACFVSTPSGIIEVERKEAANAIRYARATNGTISTIK